MKNLIGLCLMFLVVYLSACQKNLHTETELPARAFNVNLIFNAVVDSLPLRFNFPYRNFQNEAYLVNVFKFYICKIELINSDSNIVYSVNKNDHYLIDAGNPATTLVSFKAIASGYDRIAFTLGVDSSRNVSGAQTGALDPARGMFWTWNSGYIMAKLEGSSPVSHEVDNRMEYHIGGFRNQENVVKKVELVFPDLQKLEFLPGSTSTIRVRANVNAWFFIPNVLSIAATPVCTTPGKLAKQIADNYANMFSVIDIVNN